MKTYALLLALLFLVAPGSAQTLDTTLEGIETELQALIAPLSQESWGEKSARDDLQGFLNASRELRTALSTQESRAVLPWQREFTRQAQRSRTSRVLLPPESAEKLEPILERAQAVDQRLTHLRQRWGGEASQTPSSLSETPLETHEGMELIYADRHQLLIDVRDARRLASTLGHSRSSRYGLGFVFDSPNNLDSLQVRRFVQAAWELERRLSSQLEDISQSLPAWHRFEAEYQRLGYPGTSTEVRQLERVVSRLKAFYQYWE